MCEGAYRGLSTMRYTHPLILDTSRKQQQKILLYHITYLGALSRAHLRLHVRDQLLRYGTSQSTLVLSLGLPMPLGFVLVSSSPVIGYHHQYALPKDIDTC